MEQAVIGDIILVVFCLALIANAVALVRHWRALRMFQIVLANLAETQKQFNELTEAEQRRQSRPPPPEPSVPFKLG
jgi:hypothetical protein